MTSGSEKGTGSSSRKWLIAGIVLLLVIAAVSWYFSRDRGGLQEGTVIITAGDEVLGSFTIEDIKELPAVEKRLVVKPDCSGACGKDPDTPVEHLYTGVPLIQVLNSIDPSISQKYSKVITRGIDYYSQVMEMSEIRQEDEVYVMYLDYGQPLKTLSDEEGSLHLIVCSDESGLRFTKYLVNLELQ